MLNNIKNDNHSFLFKLFVYENRNLAASYIEEIGINEIQINQIDDNGNNLLNNFLYSLDKNRKEKSLPYKRKIISPSSLGSFVDLREEGDDSLYIIEYLINHGSDLKIKNVFDYNTVDLLYILNFWLLIDKYNIEHIDINNLKVKIFENGLPLPIHYVAIMKNNTESIERFIKMGVDFDLIDNDNKFSVQYAKKVETLQTFIDCVNKDNISNNYSNILKSWEYVQTSELLKMSDLLSSRIKQNNILKINENNVLISILSQASRKKDFNEYLKTNDINIGDYLLDIKNPYCDDKKISLLLTSSLTLINNYIYNTTVLNEIIKKTENLFYESIPGIPDFMFLFINSYVYEVKKKKEKLQTNITKELFLKSICNHLNIQYKINETLSIKDSETLLKFLIQQTKLILSLNNDNFFIKHEVLINHLYEALEQFLCDEIYFKNDKDYYSNNKLNSPLIYSDNYLSLKEGDKYLYEIFLHLLVEICLRRSEFYQYGNLKLEHLNQLLSQTRYSSRYKDLKYLNSIGIEVGEAYLLSIAVSKTKLYNNNEVILDILVNNNTIDYNEKNEKILSLILDNNNVDLPLKSRIEFLFNVIKEKSIINKKLTHTTSEHKKKRL